MPGKAPPPPVAALFFPDPLKTKKRRPLSGRRLFLEMLSIAAGRQDRTARPRLHQNRIAQRRILGRRQRI